MLEEKKTSNNNIAKSQSAKDREPNEGLGEVNQAAVDCDESIEKVSTVN